MFQSDFEWNGLKAKGKQIHLKLTHGLWPGYHVVLSGREISQLLLWGKQEKGVSPHKPCTALGAFPAR